MKSSRLLIFLTVLSILAAPAIFSSTKPNVLVITLDTTRADHIGCYGYSHPTSPFLDSLAEKGVVFRNAICAVPITLPSHASIFSGLYPFHTHVRSNLRTVFPRDLPTLASVLKAQGYTTRAVIGSLVLHSRFGLNKGFDLYNQTIPGNSGERSADAVTGEALSIIAKTPAPFFLWVHYYDPHYPYNPPEPYTSRFEDPYDGEIAFMDSEIKHLFSGFWKKILDNTLIVIVGDHGEGLGDHGEEEHGILLNQSTVHVPWIVYWKNHLHHRVLDQDVSIASVTPTILEALRIPVTDIQFDVPSQWTAIRQGKVSLSWLYMETYLPYLNFNWAPLRAITNGSWKYVEGPNEELYDLRRDPRETINLADKRRDLIKVLRKKMSLLTPERYGQLTESRRATVPREELKKMQSLGYLAGGRRVERYPEQLPDPKKYVDLSDEILIKAPLLVEKRKYVQLESMMKKVLRRDRHNLPAMKNLALAYMGQKKFQDAIALLKRAESLHPETDYILLSLGEAYSKTGEIEKALDCFRKAYGINPYSGELLGYYAQLLVEKRDWQHAAGILKFARDNDYENSDTLVALGLVQMHRHDLKNALNAFNRAIVRQKDNPIALYNRGFVYYLNGQKEKALHDLKAALKYDTGNKKIWETLITTLWHMGRREEANERLKEYRHRFPDSPFLKGTTR